MKTTKLIPKLAFLLILGSLVFSSVSGVQAPADTLNKYEKWVETNGLAEHQYVMPWVTISASEKSWMRPGIGQTQDDKEAGLYLQPYDVRIFIDGVEIKTQRFEFNDKYGEYQGDGVPVKWVFFTHIFEPGYFAIGEHTLRYEFYWYDMVDGVKIQQSWLPEETLFWVEEGGPIIPDKLNKYEKWVETNGLAEHQYVMPWVTISASEKSWMRPSIGQTQDDKDAGLYLQPYNVRIFIDGFEIKTQRFEFNDKNGEYRGDGVPVKWVFFTHIFEPGYFAPGEHTLRYEFYWYDMVDGVKVQQSWLPDESLFWVEEGGPIIPDKLNKYEKWVEKNGLTEEQYIKPWVTISASEKSWIRPSLHQTKEEKDAGLYFHPYDVKIFIDGVEIKTQRFAFYDKFGEVIFGDGIPRKFMFFTHIFEPGYFVPGEHTLRYEFYWCDMVEGGKVPQSWFIEDALFWVED